MATFTKTNGTMQPVFVMDTGNTAQLGTANIAAMGSVNFQGPKLDFFSVVANASLISSANVNGYINNIVQAIQTKGTVAMYQVSPASPTILNLAIYPTGAFGDSAANPPTTTSAAIMLAAANTAAVAGTNQFDSCSSVGFKLTT